MIVILKKLCWTGDRSKLRQRYTIVTLDVEHTVSEYVSIPGTRENYFYVMYSDSDVVHYRRYFCTSCNSCLLNRDFLNCTNKSCGSWKNYTFTLKKKWADWLIISLIFQTTRLLTNFMRNCIIKILMAFTYGRNLRKKHTFFSWK